MPEGLDVLSARNALTNAALAVMRTFLPTPVEPETPEMGGQVLRGLPYLGSQLLAIGHALAQGAERPDASAIMMMVGQRLDTPQPLTALAVQVAGEVGVLKAEVRIHQHTGRITDPYERNGVVAFIVEAVAEVLRVHTTIPDVHNLPQLMQLRQDIHHILNEYLGDNTTIPLPPVDGPTP